jgi:hypothetical protein
MRIIILLLLAILITLLVAWSLVWWVLDAVFWIAVVLLVLGGVFACYQAVVGRVKKALGWE